MLKVLLLALSLMIAVVHANVYEVKPTNGKVEFSITKFKINDDVTGSFKDFKGKFDFDKKKMTLADLDVTIALKSIDTGDVKRDEHLKTDPMFFDTAKYTDIKFVTEAKKSFPVVLNKPTAVEGKLTLKNVTKDVILMVTYLGDKKGLPQFSATTEINRNNFGVTYNGEYKGEVAEHLKAKFANKVLGDDVKINISLN